MLERFKDYYKRTEVEKIHGEIFKESSEHQYYLLGLAQGLYIIYDLVNKYKNQICNNDMLETIEIVAIQDENVGKYFKRLLKKE